MEYIIWIYMVIYGVESRVLKIICIHTHHILLYLYIDVYSKYTTEHFCILQLRSGR